MPDTEERLRSQPLNSLATKLILLVFVSTFVTASAVSWISITSTHSSVLGMIHRLYPASVEQTALRFASWLDRARDEVAELGGSLAGEALASDLETRLRRALRRSSRLEGVALLDASGRLVARVGTRLEGLAAGRPQPPQGPRPRLEAMAAAPGDPDAVAVLVGPGPDGGAVVGALARKEIEALLARGQPTGSGSVALIDTIGRPLAWVGSSDAPPSAPAELARREAGASSGVLEYANGAGIQVVGASHPAGERGWRIVIETPYEEAFQPLTAVVTRVLVVDLVIILLFSFAAYRVTETVVRPVEVLSEGARRIARGQIDHEIPEPATRDEIGLLTRTFNDMMRRLRRNQTEIETANRSLTERNAELRAANEILSQLSITDGLTKLHNHRFFQDHLTREIKRVGRSGEKLSLLLIDIDDFKQLNDRLGHAAGDEILVGIAQILDESVRESDLLARYGGEEFVVLASATDIQGAYQLGEKIRTSIAEHAFRLDDTQRQLRVTVSVGVAEFCGNRKRFFQKTDQALYRAKASGKNCVVADENDLENTRAAKG